MKWIRRGGLSLFALQWAIALVLALPVALRADDCGKDKSRLEDCLRSGGYAQGIATTVSVIATVLVNGVAIQTLVLQQQTINLKPGEEPPTPKEYLMNVATQDQSTSVNTMSEDPLWIYASVSCTDPKVNTTAITAAITFSASGANANWLTLSTPTMSGGQKAVAVTAAPPMEDAELLPGPTVVYAYAQAEGKQITAPVTLSIENDEYRLEIS